MESRKSSSNPLYWSIEEIPYDSIERDQVAADQKLFYLLTSASFVEITSDVYTRKLIDYFRAYPAVSGWLAEKWQREELQHGTALKRYVTTVWPDFGWEQAYTQFYGEYAPRCAAKQLGPTPALELASRCLVETGTATLYEMLRRMNMEPVLRALAGHIKNDEVRHYKYFYHYFLSFQEHEQLKAGAVFRTLWNRIFEIENEDAYYAFKHVFLESHPQQRFYDDQFQMFCRHYRMLARRYYPYEMALKMLLKPIGLSRSIRRAAVPLIVAGARYFS